MSRSTCILIADDSRVYRRIVESVLNDIEDVEVLAVAGDGQEALEKIAATSPDLVLLDMDMPRKDGIEVLQALSRDESPVPVAVLSGVADAGLTIEALRLGALEYIHKPEGAGARARLMGSLERVIRTVQALSRNRSRTAGQETTAYAPHASCGKTRDPVELVLIGVSTGGPRALMTMLPDLSPEIDCPIVVVQHMSTGFTHSLADALGRACPLPVKEAAHADPLEPGRILLAPGGTHVELGRNRIGGGLPLYLVDGPYVNSCRPSVDHLWKSVAEVYERGVLAVIMTGMGTDGLDGVTALAAKGAYCIAQDEASSVIWGMPGAVVQAKLADEVLPLSAIAGRINALVQHGI
ncbi:MAG: chemotaxis-specific protein-glutamate methyltransferase CheB [Proteobacteria bacterium]|nr:chemotaxis-specific protein-glutamate methyltransferase CheB [Pseudomonadota bacterium]